MSHPTVVHHTFSLERDYPVALDRVFAAWADPQAKAGWFAPPGAGAEHQLDFRVGGLETVRARLDSGVRVTFESVYRDIVSPHRIVYASTLAMDETLATVSITTVELSAAGDASRLLLVEQATFLDGLEQPAWREQGTAAWLDALAGSLTDAHAGVAH